MNNYFIPFIPSAKVNYITIITLMEYADYNIESNAYDTIHYISIPKLSKLVNISTSTLNRIVSNDQSNDYRLFLSVDVKHKIIKLNTAFSNSKITNKKPFIILTKAEIQILKEYNDNLLCKYLMYIKYYCGYSKSGYTDFTANQFLIAIGYQTSSNSTKERLSFYNKILKERNLLIIETFIDELGHNRNRYLYRL